MSLLIAVGASLAVPLPAGNQVLSASPGPELSGPLDPSVPAYATTCSYRKSNAAPLLAGDLDGACDTLASAGWKISESYNLVHSFPNHTDTDNVDVFTSGGKCLVSFHGADMYELTVKNYNTSTVYPVKYYVCPQGLEPWSTACLA